MKQTVVILLALCSAILVAGLSSGGGAAAQENESLESEYRAAARKHDVPVALLKAIGYTNTRWEMPLSGASNYENADPREGEPEARGAYGIMSLYKNPSKDTLAKASSLTGVSEEKLQRDREANIVGAAAVISEMQGEKPTNINGWYQTVAEYGDGNLYADQVYGVLKSGASREISTGERVVLEANPKAETPGSYNAQSTGEYPGSTWYGASSANYTSANRGDAEINYVVVHVTQGSWAGALNWFRDSRAQSSAHYTVRSSDGAIGQSVREKDIAWHAGNWSYNQQSVGIEHEGYVSEPSWFTDAMYRSSAKLSAYLSQKYNIPIDRQHIIGHNEVPGATHTDPGAYWNWDKYMSYVREYAGSGNTEPAPEPTPETYTQVVDNANSNRFSASGAWEFSNWNKQRYHWNYRPVRPKATSDPASYKFKVPARDDYAVRAWSPANSEYNTRTPVRVKTTSGWKRVFVNQARNGGRWVGLGTFEMSAGDEVKIRISRWSDKPGFVIADAFKIVRK